MDLLEDPVVVRSVSKALGYPSSRQSGQLERDMQQVTEIDPLIRTFMVHYQFEAIHPFRDGNGRVGRLLLALMIYKECGFDLPWLYLSEYFERHRDEYIDCLFAVIAATSASFLLVAELPLPMVWRAT